MASSYQRFQGQKLIERFNAFSYWYLSKAMDSHDVGRNRGGLEAALFRIKAKIIVIGISSDNLFPTLEQKFIANNTLYSEYHEIQSRFGHDGFLVESLKISEILNKVINEKYAPAKHLNTFHNRTAS